MRKPLPPSSTRPKLSPPRKAWRVLSFRPAPGRGLRTWRRSSLRQPPPAGRERRGSTVKRKHFSDTSGSNAASTQVRKPLRKRPSRWDRAPANPKVLRVADVPEELHACLVVRGDVGRLITSEEAGLLRTAILDAIDAATTVKPRFVRAHISNGHFQLACADAMTLGWLELTVAA